VSVRVEAHPSPLRSALRTLALDTRFENLWIGLILLGLIVLFGLLSPSGTFLTVENFRNIVLDASELLILAAGMTYLLIAAGLDLSIGSIVIFCSVVAAKLMVRFSGTSQQILNFHYPHLTLGLVVGITVCVLCGAGWGLFNGIVIVRLGVPPFIATLGTMGIALGLAQVLSGGLNVPNVPIPLQNFFGLGSMLGVVPWPVVVAVAVVGLLWIVLARTRFGLRTYAIGANAEAARRSGINVRLHLISLYVLMGVLSGIVGVIDIARFDTASISAHSVDVLAAISAVVIGGTSLFGGRGSMSGTIIGVFIPVVLQNGFVIVGVQPFWQNVAIGSVLIAAVYLDQMRRRASASVS
jgi:ribose transport system permease protein